MTNDKDGDGDKERRFLERHLVVLEQWRTDLTPIQNDIIEANRESGQIGLLGLKSAFLLNGGALLAVPAFFGIKGLSDKLTPAALGVVMESFFWGLGFAALALLAGYLGSWSRSYRFGRRLDWQAININVKFGGPDKSELPAGNIEDLKRRESFWQILEMICSIGALVAGILSFLAFGSGAVESRDAMIRPDPALGYERSSVAPARAWLAYRDP